MVVEMHTVVYEAAAKRWPAVDLLTTWLQVAHNRRPWETPIPEGEGVKLEAVGVDVPTPRGTVEVRMLYLPERDTLIVFEDDYNEMRRRWAEKPAAE